MMRFPFLLVCLAAALLAQQTSGKMLGKPDAPVRIELFSDYQCPACKQFHEETLRPLIADYVNRGKVYLIQREFPLPMHAFAREAACLAEASAQVGKYLQVSDQLFLTQQQWTANGDVTGAACRVLTPAEAKKVTALAKSPEIAKKVDEEIQKGQAEKVTGTPTLIITHGSERYPVTGPISYAVLSRFLDSLVN
ncbi:MAG: DsbA family protein [Bryobacterales bacterium]|nr:DsbA family protein [Bryobacterales bacterium]